MGKIYVILGLVAALGLSLWGLKHQTEQLGAVSTKLKISEESNTRLKKEKAELDAILLQNAVDNDAINKELKEARDKWSVVKDEISKINDCINAVEPVADIKRLWNSGNKD